MCREAEPAVHALRQPLLASFSRPFLCGRCCRVNGVGLSPRGAHAASETSHDRYGHRPSMPARRGRVVLEPGTFRPASDAHPPRVHLSFIWARDRRRATLGKSVRHSTAGCADGYREQSEGEAAGTAMGSLDWTGGIRREGESKGMPSCPLGHFDNSIHGKASGTAGIQIRHSCGRRDGSHHAEVLGGRRSKCCGRDRAAGQPNAASRFGACRPRLRATARSGLSWLPIGRCGRSGWVECRHCALEDSSPYLSDHARYASRRPATICGRGRLSSADLWIDPPRKMLFGSNRPRWRHAWAQCAVCIALAFSGAKIDGPGFRATVQEACSS